MYIQSGELVTILKDKLRIIAKFLTSMRFTLVVIIFLVTFIPLWIGSIYLINVAENQLINQKIERLKNQTTMLKNHIIAEAYMDNPTSESVEAEIDQLSNFFDSRVQIIDRNFRIIVDTYLMDENKYNVSSKVIRSFKGENTFEYDEENQVIEAAIGMTGKDQEEIIGVVCITFSTTDVGTVLDEISDKQLVFEMLVLVIITGLSLYFSSVFVRPFKKIEESIETISQGDFEEKISMKGYYETEQITEAFNGMIDKLKALDDSRQEFVSNVSHELKTPITSIKVLADSLLSQENIPEEMYKEFLTDIVSEIDRENAIINDLLNLVKMDKSAAELNVSKVNVKDTVELILKRLRPIAAEKNIELVFESFRPVIAEVDEVKLGIIINNLVENAIKYNVLDGWVHISLNADHKYFYLKVSDSGAGIPEELQEKVFDRFFRVDKARDRETGGTGLGLAITKGAVLMHRGSVKVYSKEEEGTTFTVRIPLYYIGQS